MRHDGAHERMNAAVKEAPLDHWIQWYVEHRSNYLLNTASSARGDVSSASKETVQPQNISLPSDDACWLGLQQLHQFLVQERPVLLYDLKQCQHQYTARQSVLQVLDSLTAAGGKVHVPGDDESDEGKATCAWTALTDALRAESVTLNEALRFYLTVVPIDSRPSHLASLQEVLLTHESERCVSRAVAPYSNPSEGFKAQVASFLKHLESFLIQTIGERAHRTQQVAAATSVAFLADDADEPCPSVLQEWLQVIQTCLSAPPDSSLGTNAFMTNENDSVLRELSRTTEKRYLTIQHTLGERRNSAIAGQDESMQQYLNAERQCNARFMAMSELRRDVEEQLAAHCLVGDTLSHSSPSKRGVRSADLAAAGHDVSSGSNPHRVKVRITDEPMQLPATAS
jgi:hypothetical protein